MPTLDVNGIKINYEIYEGGEPTLLLIHGWTANMHRWDKIIEALKGHYRMVAVDLRGHGESDKIPGAGYKLDDYKRDMIKLIESLELGKVVIAGHSMGGMIAQKIYFERPDVVRALILIGTTAKLADTFFAKLRLAYARFMFKIAYNFTYKTILSMAFSKLTPEEEKEKYIEEGLRNVPRYVTLESFTDFVKNFDTRDKLKEIKVPTLVIVGENDRVLPVRMSKFLADNIEGAELYIVEEAGHEVMIEKPEEVAKKIDMFLHEIMEKEGE